MLRSASRVCRMARPQQRRFMATFGTINPMGDRVVVRRAEAETKTATGILLPENNQRLNHGTVVAVGPGARGAGGDVEPLSLKVDDVVLLPEYGGSTVKLADEELLIIREEDILGTLSK